VKTVSAPVEQATIGRSLVIKGEISGSESLYVDGRVEGKITLPEHRVTVGRNGVVQADIAAREVVVMGKVTGNIDCGDRVDIRSEGVVNGNVATERIIVEDGALLKGGIQVRSSTKKQPEQVKSQSTPAEAPKNAAPQTPSSNASDKDSSGKVSASPAKYDNAKLPPAELEEEDLKALMGYIESVK
jgi:cytoskeletal protein CcmA (bactofilin family)